MTALQGLYVAAVYFGAMEAVWRHIAHRDEGFFSRRGVEFFFEYEMGVREFLLAVVFMSCLVFAWPVTFISLSISYRREKVREVIRELTK